MENEEKKTDVVVEGEDKKVDTISKTGEDKKEETKTFTQEQVTAMMAKEKNQGKKSALTDLGFKDEKTAKAAMESYNKFMESQKTAEQIAADKANAETEANTQAKTQAEQRAIVAEAKVEAMILGAKPDCVDDIIALAMAKKTEDGDFKTIVSELKSKYPNLFVDSTVKTDEEKKEEKKSKAGQKGTGGNVSNTKKDSEEKSLGARLATQRKIGAKKSSYFSK